MLFVVKNEWPFGYDFKGTILWSKNELQFGCNFRFFNCVQRFERLSVHERHRASDLRRLEFKPFLVQKIFDIFLCGLSIDFTKAVKAFSTSFLGILRTVLKH